MRPRPRMQYPQLCAAIAIALTVSTGSHVQAQAGPPAKPAPAPASTPPAAAPPAKPVQPAPTAEAPVPVEPAPLSQEPPPSAAPTPDEAAATIPLEAPTSVEDVPVAEPPQSAATDSEDDSLIVTGSRIKRSPELSKSAPVQVLDRTTLERTGATNTADVISALTAQQGSGVQGGGAAIGTSSVNLRGLGAGATLVLVNGRRLVPSAGGVSESFGDISVIPFAAIERIEILKGGGSAIYGADAVGGVINIITRSSFNGVHLELDGQGTSRADQGEMTASGAFGAKSERSRVMLALNYYRASQLLATQRPFSKNSDVDTYNGNPAAFIAPGFDPKDPMRYLFVDPGCGKAQGSTILPSTTSNHYCGFNYAPYSALIAQTERANGFASASFDLTEHTTLFGEFLVSHARTGSTTLPSLPVPPPYPSIPANNVDNPFGQDVQFSGRALGAVAGPQHTSFSDDTFRVVAGLRGDFADAAPDTFLENWEWELYSSWGVSRSVSLLPDSLRAPLQNAINSCSNPADLSNCFNPFYSSVDGTGTPNSTSVLNKIQGVWESITQQALQTYNAGMTGPLFKLPGGDVALAFGGEVRHEWRQSVEDNDAQQQHYAYYGGSTNARAARDVYSGYLELHWPFYRGIELQTAARIERYTDIQQTTPSPFAGLTVSVGDLMGKDRAPRVVRNLQLTGQVTSAFRAPTLYEAYPGFSTGPVLLYLPGQLAPAFTPVQSSGNPELKPEKALIVSGGVSWQPIDELVVQAELWNYDYQNKIAAQVPQQVLANDAVLMASGGSDSRVVRDPMTGKIERVQVSAYNIKGDVTTSGIDFGAFATISGATFNGSVDDWGKLSFGTQGTLTLSYRFPIDQASPLNVPNTTPAVMYPAPQCNKTSCQAVGIRNNGNFAPPLPRWRFNIPINWSFKNNSATIIGHYTGGIQDDASVNPDGTLGRMPAQLTVDLQYAYTVHDWIGKELTFRLGVYNIADTLPPSAALTINGYEGLLYDPRGRMVYAKLSSVF